MASQVYVKRLAVVAWDALSWVLAYVAFVLVRHDLNLSERVWEITGTYLIGAILLQIVGGYYLHLYLGRSRIGSFDEVTTLGTLVLTVSLFLGGMFFLTQPVFSRGVAVAMPAMAFILMAAGRWVFRAMVTDPSLRNGKKSETRALIYGAGDVGHQVANLVDSADEQPYAIVGFIDDDPGKRFLRVRSHRVLGRGRDLVKVAQDGRIEVAEGRA